MILAEKELTRTPLEEMFLAHMAMEDIAEAAVEDVIDDYLDDEYDSEQGLFGKADVKQFAGDDIEDPEEDEEDIDWLIGDDEDIDEDEYFTDELYY